MNWLYLPLRVPPDEFASALGGLRSLGFRGANVTIPYKVQAVRFLDVLKEDADLLGAVNTVVKEEESLVGYNTDVMGFTALLHEKKIKVKGAKAFIIGAGGAARAVALALLREGAPSIYIMNRTASRSQELTEALKRATSHSDISVRAFDYEGSKVLRECGLVVNCTPLAVDDKGELPLDYGDFRGGQWAIDLNYSSRRTAFLEEASNNGANTENGEGMLLHQAVASFRLWTGEGPPVEEMRRALKEAIYGKGQAG
jgi:shikimate dehydrogenase